MTVTEKNTNSDMASYSIREMTGFEIQTGDTPKRASNNVKVLTAEDHTNRSSCDIYAFS